MRGPARFASSALIYTALMFGANVGMADIAELREGDMRKLSVHETPVEAASAPFEAAGGGELTLGDFSGKIVLLNFWATWCAPCRHEMPALSTLQADYGGEDFEVVTVAAGRNPQPAMERFFSEIDVDNLPLHRDPTQQFAREMGVLGLPVTVILDREGQEIARLQGGADWASDSARAIVEALLEE
ncbi:TlpA family protein disulfide reductase [Histidinibacterium aquaticum]|nr:TlpA disulfide reductase family protein [Histidinibacterium aquaticum]